MEGLPLARIPGTWRETAKEAMRQAPESLRPHGAEVAKPERYRAFLLYAMMDPQGRILKRVVEAMSRAYNTVKHWRKTNLWDERLALHERGGDDNANAWAVRIYRVWCAPNYGRSEIATIEPHMSIAFDVAEPAPTMDADEMGVSQLMAAKKEVENVGRSANGGSGNQQERRTRHQMTVLDALIAKSAKAVNEGKLKVRTVSDLAIAIKVRNELAMVLGDVGTKGVAASPTDFQESYRVRLAQSKDGDIIQARLEDAREVMQILEGVKAARALQRGEIGPGAPREEPAEAGSV